MPEYRLRLDAAQTQKQQFDRQMKMTEDRYAWEKQRYGQGQAAATEAIGGLTGMVDQYNVAYGEARTANEQRYQKMLGIADRTVDQRSADIQSSYAGQQSNVMQRLARQGLAGTTIAPTMGMGVEREKQAALDRSKQQLAGTRLGIMERRTDEYPRSDVMMQLAQALGQGAGGAGAYGALTGMRTG